MLEHAASQAFPAYMGAVLQEAHDHLDEFDTGDVEGALSLIETFFAGTGQQLPKKIGDVVPRFAGYTPVRARWLASQWMAPELIPLPEKKYVYSDYYGFEDIRQRGARLYCAARRAQLEQNSQYLSMGERIGHTFKFLGHPVDLVVLQSSVAFNGPQRCTGGSGDASHCPGPMPNDGARSFEVPLLFGTLVPVPLDLPSEVFRRHPAIPSDPRLVPRRPSGAEKVAGSLLRVGLEDGFRPQPA